MEKAERKARANAKREALRDGRTRTLDENGTSASGAGQGSFGNVSIADATPGATFQDARGAAERFTATGEPIKLRHRRDRDHESGAARLIERERGSNRRSEKGDSGAAPNRSADEKPARGEPAISIGRLGTDETITEPGPIKLDMTPDGTFDTPRIELSPYKEDYRRSTRNGQNVYALIADPEQYITPDAYKALVSNKALSEPRENGGGWFKKPSKVLTKGEAEDLYETLVAAISDDFGYIDQLLWKINPGLDERPIWSNTSPLEDQAIAKMLLKRGQSSPAAAALVRGVVDSSDYVIVGMAILPRVNETVKAIRERPRTARKKFSMVRLPDENRN